MKGTYERRGNKIRAQLLQDGKRKSKTFETKRLAQAWVAEQVATEKTDPVSTATLAELAERYVEEISCRKKGERWEKVRLSMYARECSMFDKKLASIQREDLEAFVDDRLKLVSSGTVNRDLNLISNLFTQGRRWRMMNHNPMADLRRPKDPPPRERRITDDEIERIKYVLDFDDQISLRTQRQKTCLAFLLAIETAMRQGEISKLEWKNVHLDERYVFLPHTITKTAVGRSVPLSGEAIRLIEMLLPKTGELMLGVKASVVSTFFRQATALAGIDDLTFHDTRHEATTRLADKLQVLDLARVTGHRDIKQLMTYYNKDARELAVLL